MVTQPPLSATTVCYPLSVSPRFTLERAFEGIARAGLRLVEIVAIPDYCEHLRPEQMRDKQIGETKDLLQKYGLKANVINVAADLTTHAGVDFLGEAMRVAHAPGVSVVVTGIPQTDSDERAAAFKRLVPPIVSLCEKYGVIVALEVHGGLINSGVEGARLLEELASERLKLTYDMANAVYYAGVLPQDDLSMMGDDVGRFVAHVHLKDKANMELEDYDFPPFGKGILNFAEVLDLLAKGGYDGPMTLEVELDGKPQSPELVDQALIESYKYLEQFWA